MALGSVPVMTLITSPQRFTTNIATANRYPQRRPSHKPMAVKTQEIQTATISTMAVEPIRANPARAPGLRFQIGSRKLPGNARDTAEMKLAHVPMPNSKTRAITPKGRVLVILRMQKVQLKVSVVTKLIVGTGVLVCYSGSTQPSIRAGACPRWLKVSSNTLPKRLGSCQLRS